METVKILGNVLFIIAVMAGTFNVAYVSWLKKSKKLNVIAIFIVGIIICLISSYMYWSVVDM